jgi:uncharacterized membrane protein
MVGDFRPFFMRGLGALLPTMVTIAILVWAYRFVDQNLAQYITKGLIELYALSGPPSPWLGIDEEVALELGDPVDEWDPDTGRRLTSHYKAITAYPSRDLEPAARQQAKEILDDAREAAMWELVTRKWRFFTVIGFLLAILLIYFMGYFLASFIGRATWMVVERTIQRVPLIGAIYPNIKQVTDFFISDKKLAFAGVVAIQYPRKGIWSIGLVTGTAMGYVLEDDPRDLISVFVPSSPTPVTGYTIMIAKEDLIELPITIDEALRYTISGGVVKPDGADHIKKVLATQPE